MKAMPHVREGSRWSTGPHCRAEKDACIGWPLRIHAGPIPRPAAAPGPGRSSGMCSIVYAFVSPGMTVKGGRCTCLVHEAASPAMVFPTKGVLWLPKEVECLLRILHHLEAGPRIMPSTHLETTGVFREVSKIMRTRGYRRTAIQCRAKFKGEKATLFDTLEDWGGIPPLGEHPPSSPFFGPCGNRVAAQNCTIAPPPVSTPVLGMATGTPVASLGPDACPPPTGCPRAQRAHPATTLVEDATGPPGERVEEALEEEPIMLGSEPGSPAPEDSTAGEEEPHPDPIPGLSGLCADQRLDALERGMAQLQLSGGPHDHIPLVAPTPTAVAAGWPRYLP
ncbi:UNVERIFIED_CONTAM: hypothetical protein K2H54_055629 [Gekko kuhli]